MPVAGGCINRLIDNPMHPDRCNAIVLAALDYGERDRVVTLFSLEHGRLRCFAARARNSRKRLGGVLEPGSRLELILRIRDEGLSRIERVEQLADNQGFREQLESLALVLYAVELVELMTPEGVPFPRLFRLLTALLEWAAANRATTADRRFFEVNLLNILGYRPVLEDTAHAVLRYCLATGMFGKVLFSADDLRLAGKLLDGEIARHCVRVPKSRAFLESLT